MVVLAVCYDATKTYKRISVRNVFELVAAVFQAWLLESTVRLVAWQVQGRSVKTQEK